MHLPLGFNENQDYQLNWLASPDERGQNEFSINCPDTNYGRLITGKGLIRRVDKSIFEM